MRRTLTVLALLLGACGHASAHRHVRADGDDGGRGDARRPWRTLAHAIELARPGDTIVVHGRITVPAPVQVHRSGRAEAWIVIRSADDEPAILDGSNIDVPAPRGAGPQPHDGGVLTLAGVHHVEIVGLRIENAPLAGIAIRDSSDIVVLRNRVERSFGSGIAAWDSDHDGHGCERIRISGNTVVRSNDRDVAPRWFRVAPPEAEPPHEAISLGGVVGFEVDHNEILAGRKEGIDVKETSANGRVHHNLVHETARQGLYVDAWFGTLHDIEIDHNLVTRCEGAGLAISVEQGRGIDDLRIHDNELVDNSGTGILFGRWGTDGPRTRIEIVHNTIRHNGHGPPADGEAFFWITGGIFLYSANVEHLQVRGNLVVDNRGFQIGAGDAWLAAQTSLAAAFAARDIVFAQNVVRGDRADPPVRVGWPDNFTAVREWPVDATVATDAGARLRATDVGPAALR